MDEIVIFLSNPIVALVGYVFSLIAAAIAIWQFIGKSEAQKGLGILKLEITTLNEKNINLQSHVSNNNNIQQGEKSQYFQDNSGAVTIDNRG